MRLLLVFVCCFVVFAVPATAEAGTSIIRDGAPGEYELVDQTNTANSYRAITDADSGQWVIYDEKGTISTSGTACIATTISSQSVVRCPKVTWLKITAGGGSDNVQESVTAVSTPLINAAPFSGRVKIYGGSEDDKLYGGVNDDELYGGDGNDTLDGQAGADKMVGEGGAKDICCYGTRAEDVSIVLNLKADDGSYATDRKADFVDASNEVLETGGGGDAIDTSGVFIPAGTSCTNNPRYTLRGGAGNDTLIGNFCFGDEFDGEYGTDSASYPGRVVGVNVSQDGNANDGRPGEADNMLSSVEKVSTTEYDDELEGADSNPDPDAGRAVLNGGGGNDKITPGLRPEDIWADGYTAKPGDRDEISYEDRIVPVNVSLNGTADDGNTGPAGQQEHDNVIAETARGDNYGFDDFTLGNNDDTYWGTYAQQVPLDDLVSTALSPRHRSRVWGGPGADKFYAGTVAEDFNGGSGRGTSWLNSEQDLVSYLYRKPDTNFLHVGMSLDGKANDGQSLDSTTLTKSAIATAVVPLVTGGISRIVIADWYIRRSVKIVRLLEDASEEYRARLTVDLLKGTVSTRYSVSKYAPVNQFSAENGLTVLREFRTALTRRVKPVSAEDLAKVDALIADYESKMPTFTSNGAVLGWPALFASFRSEQDNIKDDIEAMQGSSNTGSETVLDDLLTVIGSPVDYIYGNDKDNVVLGSPGPDHVEGGGGNDVLGGDLPSSASDDTLIGGSENDTLLGGGGEDQLVGGRGTDMLIAASPTTKFDGLPDHLFCGDLASGVVRGAFGLYDAGPLERDITVTDVEADADEISPVCKGTPATASSVHRQGSTLYVASDPGQQNKIKVESSGSQLSITDSAGAFEVDAGSGCSATAIQVTCPSAGLARVQVDTGDLKDSVDLSKLVGIPATINTDDGNDKITGSSGNDTIDAGPGKDKVKARGGDDVIDGGTGRDVLDGGDGSDTIDYSKRNDAVDVYLAQPSTKGNGETTQTLSNFDQNLRVARSLENDTIKWAESVKGGTGSDILQGNQLANTIDAGKGDDALSGGDGDDQLLPGIGSDNILAGNGNDRVDARDSYVDLKIDCGPGTDTGSKDTGPQVFDPTTIGCEF